MVVGAIEVFDQYGPVDVFEEREIIGRVTQANTQNLRAASSKEIEESLDRLAFVIPLPSSEAELIRSFFTLRPNAGMALPVCCDAFTNRKISVESFFNPRRVTNSRLESPSAASCSTWRINSGADQVIRLSIDTPCKFG